MPNSLRIETVRAAPDGLHLDAAQRDASRLLVRLKRDNTALDILRTALERDEAKHTTSEH